jgi:hypothetical protein
MTQDILAHVLGLHHAAKVWATVADLFKELPKAKIGMLNGALTNTTKLDMTTTQFLSKIKG